MRYRWSWHPGLMEGCISMLACLLDDIMRLMIFLLSIGSTATTSAFVLLEHWNWSVLRIATLSIETHGIEFQDFRMPGPMPPLSRDSASMELFVNTHKVRMLQFRGFSGNFLCIGTHWLVRVALLLMSTSSTNIFFCGSFRRVRLLIDGFRA